MNTILRFGRTCALTIWNFADELINELAAPALHAKLPASPGKLGRLAGVRVLATKTIDGAVIEGAVAKTGAKFTIPKGLPEEQDGRRLIIENELHTLDGFSGEIKEGYGKGTKTLLWKGPVVVKTGKSVTVETAEYHFHEAEKAGPHYDLAVTGVPSQQFSWKPKPFEIHFPSGPLGNKRYAIVNTLFAEGRGGRMLVPLRDHSIRLDKPAYILKDPEWLKTINKQDWILERKLDGSLGNASFYSGRAYFRSHRESSNDYFNKIPQAEFLWNSSRLLSCRKLFPQPVSINGTVLRTELVHPQGVSTTSGILNSNADRAIQTQQKLGPVQVYVWDVMFYRGRDVSHWPYKRRRELAEKTVREIRCFNKNWHLVDTPRFWESPESFYQRVTSDRRGLPYSEGIVAKHRIDPDKSFVKVKFRDSSDLKVIHFLEGSGKYKGSLGSMIVENPDNGAVGEVGSFAISDEQRQFIWDNRKELTGAVAKVRVQAITARGVPRAGVFEDFHRDKGPDRVLSILASEHLFDGEDA